MSHNSATDMVLRVTSRASTTTVLFTIVSSVLAAVAAYFWAVIDSFKIPITPGLPEIATFLPVVNFVAIKYLTKGGSRGTPAWSLKAGILSIFLVALDTFVITQAANNIPVSSITCPLERTWHGFFNKKDAKSIRALQDAFNCCGLSTIKEQAWPFADGKEVHADKCSKMFNTTVACLGPWTRKYQLSAGMFMGVALAMLLTKVVVFVVYRRRSRNQIPANQKLLGPGVGSGIQNDSGQISGVRLRPDERTRYSDNIHDDDDDEEDNLETIPNESTRLLEAGEGNTRYEAAGLLEGGERPVLPAGDEIVWQTEQSRRNSSR